MDVKEFECSECGSTVEGPQFAYMIQMSCPSCNRDVNAYPV